jgi:arylsulfatase A-like enzyme
MQGDEERVRDRLYGVYGGYRATRWIRDERHKYIWYGGTNEEQLFDLHDDPYECRDLSGDTDLADFRQRVEARGFAGDEDAFDASARRPLGGATPEFYWPSES